MNEDVQQLNRDALSRVQEETGALFRAADYAAWRPTRRTAGVIRGIDTTLVCVATDGVRGLFVTQGTSFQLGSAFFGHVSHFEWHGDDGEEKVGAPPTLHAAGTGVKEKKPRRAGKKERLQKLWDTL